MFQEHKEIQTPPDETVIWRYIDLPKLLDLFCSKSLYFCRGDRFVDPWEGMLPKSTVDSMREELARFSAQFHIDDDVQEAVIQSRLQAAENTRTAMFINCWHGCEHESASLWDSYAGRSGFAIKSTVGRLKSAIAEEQRFYIGQVTYHDFSQGKIVDTGNAYSNWFRKRESFEHENEIRALVVEFPPGGVDYILKGEDPWPDFRRGVKIPVDLVKLIETVYVSPLAPGWLAECVKQLTKMFALPDEVVQQSNLYSKCVY